MEETVDILPFSVANILKESCRSKESEMGGSSSPRADNALALAERLADVIMDAKNNPDGRTSKRRRVRTSFTQHQLITLESVFSHTHYPDVVMRQQLAMWTAIPETKIQVWFKNRRAKFRKNKKRPSLGLNKEETLAVLMGGIPQVSICLPLKPSLMPAIASQCAAKDRDQRMLYPLSSVSDITHRETGWTFK